MKLSNRSTFLIALAAAMLVLATLVLAALPNMSLSAASDPGLQLHWELEQPPDDTGGTPDYTDRVKDTTVNARDGEISDATWVTDRDANANGALSFDGNNDTLLTKPISSNIQLNDLTELSMATWIRAIDPGSKAASPIMRLLLNPDSTDNAFFLGRGYGTWVANPFGCGQYELFFFLDRKTDDKLCGVCTNIDVVDNSWHHVVAVWDAERASTIAESQFKLYIDGIDRTDATFARTCQSSSIPSDGYDISAFNVGYKSWSGPYGYYKGSLDDIRIYDTALTASEVQLLYEKGTIQGTEIYTDAFEIVGPLAAVYGEDTDYQIVVEDGVDVPIDYTWVYTSASGSEATSSPGGTPVGDQYWVEVPDRDELFHTLSLKWSTMTPTPPQFPTTRVITASVINSLATEPLTKTRVITLTYRPVLSDIAGPYVINEDEVTPSIPFLFTDEDLQDDYDLAGTTEWLSTMPSPLVSFLFYDTTRTNDTRVDSTMVITPAADTYGTTTVTISATDKLVTGTDQFTLQVLPVNDPPTFTQKLEVSVMENSGAYQGENWALDIHPGPYETDQDLEFELEAARPELFSSQPTIQVVTQTYQLSGTQKLSITNQVAPFSGTLRFEPALSMYGTTPVTVTLHDDGGTERSGIDVTEPQVFTVTIVAINTLTTTEDTPLTMTQKTMLASKSDISEWVYTAPSVSQEDGTVETISPTNAVVYTPPPNFYGNDVFTYTMQDGTVTETVQMRLEVIAVNDAPAFVKGADQFVPVNSGLHTADPWATSIAPGPANEMTQTVWFSLVHGSPELFAEQPSITNTGVLTFTPAIDARGQVTVTVRLHDNGGTAYDGVDTSAPQEFSIEIGLIAPQAVEDAYTTEMNKVRSIFVSELLSNDTDADGDTVTYQQASTTTAQGGTVSFTDTPTPTLFYQPPLDYIGGDSFTYTIADSTGLQGTGTVNINVLEPSNTFHMPLIMVQEGTPVQTQEYADLVGSFTLSPAKESYVAGEPVVIEATITNQGTAAATDFWVDFYINPSPPPSSTNLIWNNLCSMTPCYGIVWGVTTPLQPGESMVLTTAGASDTVAGGYNAEYTIWPGSFASGTSDLYLYVDTWNQHVVSGGVVEWDETNNSAYRAVAVAEANLYSFMGGGTPSLTANDVPPRPARPGR